MNRREFMMASGLAVLAAAPADSLTGLDQGRRSLRTGPYLQNPAAAAMTVMWMTHAPCYGFVECGPTERLGLRADVEVDGQRHAGNLLHRVRLSGLEPGRRCFYRVRCESITEFRPGQFAHGPDLASPVWSFTTPDPTAKRVRFLVYNDIHDKVRLWRNLHTLVAREAVDFVFLNGDIVDVVQDEQRMVDNFLGVCTDLFAREVPFLYARGNHETRGAFSGRMRQYLDLPHDRYYYGFSWGPARFVVLDTGEGNPDDARIYGGLGHFDAYRTVQQQWLERETTSTAFTAAHFRVAIHHIPAFYNVAPDSDDQPANHGAIDARNKWWPLFNQRGVNLYLGGHTHQHAIKAADPAVGHNFPVVIGGGPIRGTATVMLVEIDANMARVKMFADDGHTIGEIVATS